MVRTMMIQSAEPALKTNQPFVSGDSLAIGDAIAALGHEALAREDHHAARLFYRKAVTCGTSSEIFEPLARAVFPGPNYRTHLAALHEAIRPSLYLEIGVFDGDTLALAQPGTHAIGVDPAPRPTAQRPYSANTTLHRTTSDIYFNATAMAANPAIDLAFIDGLHHFDQVLRDFINVERNCHKRSVIALHDTLPIEAVPAERQRRSAFWCGDVWKIVPCLRRYRPDLTIVTVPAFPSGLTIVFGVNPASDILADRYDEAMERFDALAWRRNGSDPSGMDGWGVIANDPVMLCDLVRQFQSGCGSRAI